jgi:hypothetical protein
MAVTTDLASLDHQKVADIIEGLLQAACNGEGTNIPIKLEKSCGKSVKRLPSSAGIPLPMEVKKRWGNTKMTVERQTPPWVS